MLDDDIKLDCKDLFKFEKDWTTKDDFSFTEFVLHIENFIQKKINKGIEDSIRVVLQKSVSYIDRKMDPKQSEQDLKIDQLEARQVRKIIEFKKLLFDIEQRANQMYF